APFFGGTGRGGARQVAANHWAQAPNLKPKLGPTRVDGRFFLGQKKEFPLPHGRGKELDGEISQKQSSRQNGEQLQNHHPWPSQNNHRTIKITMRALRCLPPPSCSPAFLCACDQTLARSIGD